MRRGCCDELGLSRALARCEDEYVTALQAAVPAKTCASRLGGSPPSPHPRPALRSCTFARVALVPLFVLLWHTAHDYASIATASVFILAALTDWLDGYLARRVRGRQ